MSSEKPRDIYKQTKYIYLSEKEAKLELFMQ